MPAPATSPALASLARRSCVGGWISGLPAVVQAVEQGIRVLAGQAAEPAVALKRRELVPDFHRAAPLWLRGMSSMLRAALDNGTVTTTRLGDLPPPPGQNVKLTLVEDDTIELEIVSSRLALAMMDRAASEFTDLRSRMNLLEGRDELDTHDVLRPHVVARIVTAAWRSAGLGLDAWRIAQSVLHEEFAHCAEERLHEANRQLIERQVLPEIDLRPFIRRAPESARGGSGGGGFAQGPNPGESSRFGGAQSSGGDVGRSFGGAIESGRGPVSVRGADPGRVSRPGRDARPPFESRVDGSGASAGGAAQGSPVRDLSDETRMMTRGGPLAEGLAHAAQVLGGLNRLVGRQAPGFGDTSRNERPIGPKLKTAIADAQASLSQRLSQGALGDRTGAGALSTPELLEELNQRRVALKQAAATPVERATIEIVALLFQSILTEERIPAAVRLWFARLQMPVLRVAVGEPDFFATIDHPARRLIDRMGACVMGFDANSKAVGDLLEKEIKRVVQVVEAYPDTGRRVFQTVLAEFEKFLEHYFQSQNEASRKGVSLAQQVEQRETLAIQYTIELRKMLNEMPVQEGVREFLFQVWADVLAMTAVKSGGGSDETREMKRAAADLIWSASAKVSRDERAEVIRRLPPLLKTIRDGMDHAGVPAEKQDVHIQRLNNSLAAAFTAKTAAIPRERLEELKSRLETLEELLPEADDLEIDESMVHDLSGQESSDLEVVGEGGSMPTAAMLAWAGELQVGSWFMLDYRGRNEQVQLAWHGMRRQLTLFVSPLGRGILFQQHRLAAFLQAGLLVPAQEESLTVRATRNAMARLDGDPARLLA